LTPQLEIDKVDTKVPKDCTLNNIHFQITNYLETMKEGIGIFCPEVAGASAVPQSNS